jgi:hypothetical protein
MIIKYLLVLFYIDGPVWLPQFTREFIDYNKCMSEAITIQLDKKNPYNSACMPIYEEAPKTPS